MLQELTPLQAFIQEQESGLLFYNLQSGSGGNCSLVSDGHTHVIIDLGISKRKLSQRLRPLGLQTTDLHGLALTHLHFDHVCQSVADLHCPVFFPLQMLDILPQPNVTAALCTPSPRWQKVSGAFQVGTLKFLPLSVSHDGPGGTVCYLIKRADENGPILFYGTDMGVVTDKVQGALGQADFIAFESNHSPRQLKRSGRPWSLVQRILGPTGHLSNGQFATAISQRLKEEKPLLGIMPLHLSADANSIPLVDTMMSALTAKTDTRYWVSDRKDATLPLWVSASNITVWPEALDFSPARKTRVAQLQLV